MGYFSYSVPIYTTAGFVGFAVKAGFQHQAKLIFALVLYTP